MKELPEGWQHKPLSDVADIILGQSPPGTTYNTEGEGVPFFQGKAEFGDLYPEVRKWTTEPKKLAKAGDVLISVRAPVGPTNIAHIDCSVGRGLAALRVRNGMPTKYLLYAVRSSSDVLASKATGTTFSAISGDQLKAHSVVVAPIGEQQRIVEVIEEQFSRLDAGLESLQRAKRNLTRLRASILKAAVEGVLSRRDSSDQPAEVLLEIIATSKLRAPTKRFRREQPKDDVRRPDLPAGWAWALPDQVAAAEPNALSIGPFGSDLKVSDYRSDGVPLVFVRNIRSRYFGEIGAKFVSHEKAAGLSAHTVRNGDLLITKMGDPPGDAAIYTGQHEAIITADCIKLRPHPALDVRYLELAANSPLVRSQVLRITKGVAQLKVSLGRFRSEVAIPLPPRPEQARIVAEVDRRVSIIDAIDAEVHRGLERSSVLRRAVLHSAFRGQLNAVRRTERG